MFEALHHGTPVKGGAHTHCIGVSDVHMNTSPTLNRSLAIQHFKLVNVFKIYDGIIFSFYLEMSNIMDLSLLCPALPGW